MGTTDQHKERDPILKKYSRLAREYDTRWSFYIDATTRATVARFRLPLTGRVLDVGCGTGALLHEVASKFPQLTLVGVDPVPEMLAIARERVPPRTELRDGWAEELPFEANGFDLVVSCNMFHYVQHPVTALMEMSRVLRPGGELIITDWCDDYLTCRVCDRWLRLFSPAHVKVYSEREFRELFKEAGYPLAHIERYKINWLWGLMTARITKHAA